ncbi:hypothetical protein OESDEN_24549 [Oesophagostomum dentatum]|uniref:SCP domain-containing protein n=1 Tax=Oesophagostomum dentatum TaxID=61180 RepID=A0A0B1RT37_OESDE|nr:hypothetical protein OESDEN_24549 [Oesophagostomum dentatum]
MDLDWTEPTMYHGILDWLDEIQDEPIAYDQDAIRYTRVQPSIAITSTLLMRRSITGFGCGGVYCNVNGMHKYRGLCLTNKP